MHLLTQEFDSKSFLSFLHQISKVKLIVLSGMPASGKSTLGAHISKILDLPFVDLDSFIETKEKKSVSEIFLSVGEMAFREIEQKTLAELVSSSKGILSLGGGTPCFYNNSELLLTHTFWIHLDVPTDILLQRSMQQGERPLFKDLNNATLNDTIESLRTTRMPYYSKAEAILTQTSIEELMKLTDSFG